MQNVLIKKVTKQIDGLPASLVRNNSYWDEKFSPQNRIYVVAAAADVPDEVAVGGCGIGRKPPTPFGAHFRDVVGVVVDKEEEIEKLCHYNFRIIVLTSE